MIQQNQHLIEEINFEDLSKQDLVDLCSSLSTELQHVSEIKTFQEELLVDFRAQKARQQKLLSNKSMNGNLKVLLINLEEHMSADRFSPVDVFELERGTGLSHSTVSRLLRLLQDSYHAIARQDTFQERKKEQRKIVVNKLGIQPTQEYLQHPENLTPVDAGQERKKRKRDVCVCGSRDTQRIYHLICKSCGREEAHYPDDFESQDELVQVERVGDLPGQDELVQVERVGDLPGQDELVQVERVGDLPGQDELVQVERVGDFFLNEEQTLFVERWRIVSHNPHFIPRNVQEYNDIVDLAAVITTTEMLQTEFDAEYARLTEYAKGMGRIATPPRLYNLRKRLPDLLAGQAQNQPPGTTIKERKYQNWTGQAPPELDYSLVLEMAAERDRQRKSRPASGGTWRSEDAGEFLKRIRRRKE